MRHNMWRRFSVGNAYQGSVHLVMVEPIFMPLGTQVVDKGRTYIMGRIPSSLGQLRTPEHKAWNRDREQFLKVPWGQSARRAVGLAVLLGRHGAEAFENGRQYFLNEEVRWLRMVDLRPGSFPVNKSMNGRAVAYASLGCASFNFDAPQLTFTGRQSWDHRFMPFGQLRQQDEKGNWATTTAVGDILNSDKYPVEFRAANQVSALMTQSEQFCVFGNDWPKELVGEPRSPAWAKSRPNGSSFAAPDPALFMPRPILSFDLSALDRLYFLATTSGGLEVLRCPNCNHGHRLPDFSRPEFETEHMGGKQGGNGLLATCPQCGERRKYFYNNSVRTAEKRFFPEAFRDGFCDAVSEGIPIEAPMHMHYVGAEAGEPSGRRGECRVVRHVFTYGDQQEWILHLPEGAQVRCVPGQGIKAGATIAHALSFRPMWETLGVWGKQSTPTRWKDLHNVCGGSRWVPVLQKIWFDNQAVWLPAGLRQEGEHLKSMPSLPGFPTELLGRAATKVQPREMWWDMSPACHLLDDDGTAVFPALRREQKPKKRKGKKGQKAQLPHPSTLPPLLRLPLPGAVDLDLTVDDDRFVANFWKPKDKVRTARR